MSFNMSGALEYPSLSESIYAIRASDQAPHVEVLTPVRKSSAGCWAAGLVITTIIIALVIWLVVILVNNPSTGCVDDCDGGRNGCSCRKATSAKVDVVELSSPAHLNTLLQTHFVIILCHAPWCGHCKKMVPEFEQAAQACFEQGLQVKFAQVTEGVNKSNEAIFFKHLDLKGFPTMCCARQGETFEQVKQINVGRDFDSLVKFVQESVKA